MFEIGASRLPPITVGCGRPVVDDLAVRRLVPTRTAAHPRGFFHLFVQIVIEARHGFRFHIHKDKITLDDGLDSARYIACLAFDHEDDRIVSQVGIRAVEHKKIGKAWYRHAEISFRTVSPSFIQGHTVHATDFHGREEICRLKSSGENNAVHHMLLSILGYEAIRFDAGDRVCDKRNVFKLHGLVVVIRQQHPLAPDRVVGYERLRQIIEKHVHYTNSSLGRNILEQWEFYQPRFVKVMPVDYRRALEEMELAQSVEAIDFGAEDH